MIPRLIAMRRGRRRSLGHAVVPRSGLGFSRLDFKLGLRVLVRYPGLTLVGGFAIAFAVAVAALGHAYVGIFFYPRLGLPNADRIVGLQLWDAEGRYAERRALHDFRAWRAQLRSVVDLGAARTVTRNLSIGNAPGEPARVAEISASAFRVAGVRPLLGRALGPADEAPGAPPAVVIGYDIWQSRFAGDRAVVGRTVRVGGVLATVVGVMPEKFAFPRSQSVWVPLRVGAEYGPREGPNVLVFGRLAPGVTLERAQAEVATLGRRAAADFPATHRHLRAEVLPYAEMVENPRRTMSSGVWPAAVHSALLMLLVLVSANVGMLLFARAATREREIVVRAALGASRARIVAQLFVEALVLGALAAAVGLATAAGLLRWAVRVVEQSEGTPLPFWAYNGLAPSTVLYAAALTLLAAVLAGVLPSLRVTRGLQPRLGRISAGGGGFRFSGVWTAVIVAQVALAVSSPVMTFFLAQGIARVRAVDPGVPAEEFVTARLALDPGRLADGSTDTSLATLMTRFERAYGEAKRRLVADPGVLGVTFASALPGMFHWQHRLEVEGDAATDTSFASCLERRLGRPGKCASSASVALDYFAVMDAPVLAGRGFHSGDLAEGARTVIVNQSFVRQVLGGRNPLGRRVRYAKAGRSDAVEPWYEIVGVVRDLGMTGGDQPGEGAGLYHPSAPDRLIPILIAVRVRGDGTAFAPRLRAAIAAADPALRLDRVQRLDQVRDVNVRGMLFGLRLLLALNIVALLLSLAGIYAVTAFTVARRTREIGVRVALGASAHHVMSAIFVQPLSRVGLGVLAGAVLAAVQAIVLNDVEPSVGRSALLVGYAALGLVICLLACVVPTWRALRVQPTEALRVDA